MEEVAHRGRCEALYGHRVPTVENAAVSLSSEVGERLLALHPDAPFDVIRHRSRDDAGVEYVRYSLRSRQGGHDVSETVRKFGGGGHRSAAGFTKKAK